MANKVVPRSQEEVRDMIIKLQAFLLEGGYDHIITNDGFLVAVNPVKLEKSKIAGV